MNLLIFFFFFLSSLLLPPSVSANWYKYSTSPVLNVGLPDSWDSRLVASSSLLYDGMQFRMWYEGRDKNMHWRIGYATSTDGINWNKYSTYVLNYLSDYDNQNAHDPKILLKDGIYHLWYAASNPYSHNIHINHTTSSDGINWTNSDVNVLTPTFEWEKGIGISSPYTIYDENQYKMWYVAHGNYQGSSRWRIGYATSTDGINWNKYSTPLIEPTQNWEGYDIGHPIVIIENGTYKMWYHAGTFIGFATSIDGIHWEKDKNNPTLSPGPASFDITSLLYPFVVKKDNIYYMYYTGVGADGVWRIGLATSQPLPAPLTTPTLTSTPAITPSLTPSSSPSSTPTITPTLTPSPTITLTPTPTLVLFSPIIIIPGLGASWNPRAIFSCNLSPGTPWKLAPYVSAYNRLMTTLTKNAHLILNNDVYLYTYDWRLPLDQQGQALKSYIDELLKDKPAETRVRLIGHSLGGLVIRSYLANNPDTHKAKSVLTIGTPHQGTVLAYPIWEKGEIWADNWAMQIALNQLITHCRYAQTDRTSRFVQFKIKTRKETVQLMAPVIRQLLPIFDFLKENGKIKSTNQLFYQNDWLPQHLSPPNFYNADFVTLSGNNTPTLRFLNIASPASFELAEGDWPDGKPVSSEKVLQGDGTVLTLSSQLDKAENLTISGNHGEIISTDEAIGKILEFLDLPYVVPVRLLPIPDETSQKALVVSLDKDANIRLIDPQNKTSGSQENIITLFDPKRGNYLLNITSPVTTYATLYITQLDREKDTFEQHFTLHLRKDQPFRLTFSYQ